MTATARKRTRTPKPSGLPAWSPPLLNALRWPERIKVSDWADRYRELDPMTSAEAGRWDTARAPYQREWMDSALLSWVSQITVMKSTQVGGTEFILNVLAHAICEDPGPILYVLPNKEEGEKFYEERLLPLVQLCAPLRAQLTNRKHDAKKRSLLFRRCRFRVRSAGVAMELAQFPARYLAGDECDKWPRWTGSEAAPFELAQQRQDTYPNAKTLLGSTPVLEQGMINREFLAGDRRRYYVPCPHCHGYQVLRWQNMKKPEDVHTEQQMVECKRAWFVCEKCSGIIEQHHQRRMLELGAWVPERLAPDGNVDDLLQNGRLVVPEDRHHHRSYHIWAAYSPFPGAAWWKIMARWLKAHGDPSALQNFVNSILGEPWVEKVDEPKVSMLRECVAGYQRGEVPAGAQVITAGVDVQKRFLAFTIRGWGLQMESWLLDHGRVDNFDQLAAALFARDWPRALMIRGVFIDSQYRQPEVIDFARKYPAVVKLLKGDEFEDPRPFNVSKIERHPRTGAAIGIQLWRVNVGLFKDELAAAIKLSGESGAFHVYRDAGDDYLNEMTSEHKVLERQGKRGTPVERWQKKHGRAQNHFWDTEVYNRAIAKLLRIDSLRESAAVARRPTRDPRRERGGMAGFGGALL